MYTHLSTTAVSPFLYCFTMSWWVNSWISVELQLCCCGNKSRVRAWSPVCGSTLRVSHVRNCFGPVSDLPSSRITSLLAGLEFTPPSSARTRGDIYVPGTHANIFFLIFRLMGYTFVCFFHSRAFFLRVNRLLHN